MREPHIVRDEVKEVVFGFYTDDDILKLSVCQVKSPVARDALGHAVSEGLSDPRMGPTAEQIGQNCVTCNLSYQYCPGHPGHILLDYPVYYPLLMPNMFLLLRCKCIFCHKLKVAKKKERYQLVKLKLLEMGDISNLHILDNLMTTRQIFNDNDTENTAEQDLDDHVKLAEEKYKRFCRNAKRKPVDSYCRSLQTELIEDFQKQILKKKLCENCGKYTPSYRKDGYSKIFLKPFSKKYKNADTKNLKSGLETTMRGDDEQLNDSESEFSDDDVEDKADKYLPPIEVEAQIKLLWNENLEYLDFIWSKAINNGLPTVIPNPNGWKIFFSRTVAIPPNRFRPNAVIGEATSEHPQNTHLIKILETNEKIRKMVQDQMILKLEENDSVDDTQLDTSKLISHWIELQNAVNCYMDSAKDPNILGPGGGPSGIRQILERKEGLFRKHMMGKRVNYCARSVISPDPNIGTDEIGIPVHFAKTLHYPTPVNDWNVKHLRTLVERGPNEYPGANQIETADGKLINLAKLSAQERAGKAKLLLATPGIKVYRHLINGDVLLLNRQPTLHKPGIMAHKARVLKHVKEQTLRMNYANCNAYNADFDGDEMNCHFVQNELARAEASYICNTDNQYIVPTSGNPLRGLIQDHVASGVKLTCKDTFLTKAEFQQLLYIAISGLPGTEIVDSNTPLILPLPTVWKPQKLWTGKQVITALLAQICRDMPPINLDGKTRTPPTAFGQEHNEHIVIIRAGELLCGVIDKSSIGNASLGIVHAVYELHGAEAAGRLLNSFGRLFTYHLQNVGHSCGIEDLILTSAGDAGRLHLLEKVKTDSRLGLKKFLDGKQDQASSGDVTKEELHAMKINVAKQLSEDRQGFKVKLDGAMQQSVNKSASDVIKACIPNALQMSFLKNNFSMMVLTGAKGSAVNQSQISCFLGQQALEGQRVPVMISGKTLPSFQAYDVDARAGGFVRDRFLTGVKPQEYYFHCMAGREGLVDTAVKTSRSGYLQRCLVKHLEELRVHYDMTVRDSGGNIVQFLYGEDGLDPMSAALLGGKANQMLFIARNNQALVYKYAITRDFFSSEHGELAFEMKSAQEHHKRLEKARSLVQKKDIDLFKKGSVILARRKKSKELTWSAASLMPNWHVATITKSRADDKLYDLEYLDGYIEKKVPQFILVKSKLCKDSNGQTVEGKRIELHLIKVGLPDTAMSTLRLDNCIGAVSEKIQDAITDYIRSNPDDAISSTTGDTKVSSAALELLVWVKYMRSLACPGEAVGCVAAQSVGEPSTQMTLNTFHLAGHGGANVTLGIPRLREIIMTAARVPKTPMMIIPLREGKDLTHAKALVRQLSRLAISQLLSHEVGVEVCEKIAKSAGHQWNRHYQIQLNFENPKKIFQAFGIKFDAIGKKVETLFMGTLQRLISIERRRAGQKGASATLQSFQGTKKISKNDDDDDPDEGYDALDNVDDDDNENTKKSSKKSTNVIDDGDDDDDEDDEDDDQEDDLGQKKKDDEEDDDEEDDDLIIVIPDPIRKPKDDDSNDSDYNDDEQIVEEDDDDDDDLFDNKSKKGKKTPSKKASAKAPKTPKTPKTPKSSKKVGGEGLNIDEENGIISFSIIVPANSRRLLMLGLVETAAENTPVRSTQGISNAYPMKKEFNGIELHCVQTEGVNYEAMWQLPDDLVHSKLIYSNHIYGILETYGVEATRSSIVQEIVGVFSVYGIDVNLRHLSLIADYMTRSGGYMAMNRIGMLECPSPFLQMSFETTTNFVVRASMLGQEETLESPSARIVLGEVAKVGTGGFDLLVPIEQTHD